MGDLERVSLHQCPWGQSAHNSILGTQKKEHLQCKVVHMHAWMYLKTMVSSGSERVPRVGLPRQGKPADRGFTVALSFVTPPLLKRKEAT